MSTAPLSAGSPPPSSSPPDLAVRNDGRAAEPLPADLADFRHAAFHQLIHLVERWVGEPVFTTATRSVTAEVIRFRTANRFSFPGRDIDSLAWLPRTVPAPTDGTATEAVADAAAPAGDRLQVTVTFLGLLGVASPLPSYYVEDILSAEKGISPDEQALRDFLDLFDHRLLTLAHLGWKRYRHYATFAAQADDRISRYLFALLGLSPLPDRRAPAPWLRGRVDWLRLLPYAGLLISFGRSASAVATVLGAYFHGLPLVVEEGVRRRAPISPEQQSALGRANTALGDTFLLGTRVPDLQGAIRIRLGPLPPDAFARFLPDRDDFQTLCGLLETLVRDPLDIAVTVIRTRADYRGWRLGTGPRAEAVPEAVASATAPPRLGWSSWLSGPTQPGPAHGPPPPDLSVTVSVHRAERFRAGAGAVAGAPADPNSHHPGEG